MRRVNIHEAKTHLSRLVDTAVRHLPLLHGDPFDRLLRAQVEGLTLLTADRTLARYPGPIRLVT
jgi:PIN domain nuclease of toxin-antitoxin system